MKVYKIIILGFLVAILTNACSNDSINFLDNRDFNHGDWLLVKIDNSKRKEAIYIIDDETVLKDNSNSIKVKFSEKDMYTTCDGRLMLFKDGEIIADQDYLEPSRLNESESISSKYKIGHDTTIEPRDMNQYKIAWDSLRKISKCYPTRYHAQPADKDIIWIYKYE